MPTTTEEFPRPAVDVLRAFLAVLETFDAAAIACWLTDDGILEFPFAPRGVTRAAAGRVQTDSFLRAAAGTFSQIRFTDVVVHAMVDPTLAVAEFRSEGVMASTGRPYRNRYVSLARVRGGKILEYREFFDPAVAISASRVVPQPGRPGSGRSSG